MKDNLSITLEKKTVFDILDAVKTGSFRSKSHVVEFAVKKLLEEENDKINKMN